MTVEQFVRQLAEQHGVDPKSFGGPNLLKHLQIWEETLRNAYLAFRATSSDDQVFSQAGEWVLDNYYVVQQNLHLIEENLPPRYLNQLPVLTGTTLEGYPRAFALAWEWVGYCQSQIDLAQFESFIQDYQQVTPLTIGELWALPTMLRIAILERLASVVAVITGVNAPYDVAAKPILPVPWRIAHQTLVANSFSSLRILSVADWKLFFEQISRVEQVLRNDPAGIYADMDFETRNRYRGVVEELAQYSSQSQEAVALAALELTRAALDQAEGDASTLRRESHIGFYLVDKGRAALEARVGYRPNWSMRLWGWFLHHPTKMYLGRIVLLSSILLSGLLIYAGISGASLLQWVFTALLGFGLALEAAIMEVQWDVTHKIMPQRLPRMDFSHGIAPGHRTMVVIPTMLANAGDVAPMLQDVEQHFLANPDPQLTFALLTDFTDSASEVMLDDESLLAQLKNGIEALNQKYKQQAFYVFHRPRKWNAAEGVWMGWERKRGKLAEFNQLLLKGRNNYLLMVGEQAILPEIKYVITLDADTSLPQESAARLVATLAHPLNRAQFAPDGRSVVAGYTILQPRVAIKPTSANRSRFSQIFAGDSGFDLYTLAVSDVYQDLFGEGSFVGKGIYDVAAFEQSVDGQIPENTLLSHDLFEGIHGRAALVTDIILYEEYPTRYMDYARRLKRWIRGDWQLLPWLLNRQPTVDGARKNRVSLINRWKVFDNLRRSLFSPNLMLILAAAWLGWLPGSPLAWSLFVLVVPALGIFAQMLSQFRHNWRKLPFKEILETARVGASRWALFVAFLPYESFLALGAIAVTLNRIFNTRKQLLRWTTAAHAARLFLLNPRYEIQAEMGLSLIFVALLALLTARINPIALVAVIPLLVLWGLSPQVAYWISQPIVRPSAALSDAQHQRVQRLARRTWAYFEQYVGPDDHWLPPDHFQESPRGNVAHYTTPTNIGLLLLSTFSAHDLGYISVLELAVRLTSTFDSLDQLEKYRGHFLNWYDTQTMTALLPRYISTVDSGNLAASLIAFRQGCLSMKNAPIFGAQQWQGLLVLLDILTTILEKLQSTASDELIEPFTIGLENIRERILAVRETPEAWTIVLTWLAASGWETISRRLIQVLENPPDNLDQETLKELQLYLNRLHSQLLGMQKNIDLLAPWLSHLNQQPPSVLTAAGGPLAENWQIFKRSIPDVLPTLEQAGTVYSNMKKAIGQLKTQLIRGADVSEENQEAYYWCQKLDSELDSARMRVEMLLLGYASLAGRANASFNEMDFKFLFHPERQVFHIGYNITNEKLDDSYYDLLASEARIASLVAIAKGDAPQSHWARLGRPVTQVSGRQVLLSWSGTMFEYLMPLLLTKNYEETFLHDSTYIALDAQISYGKEKNTPWGISESGYYIFDASMNYQYRAFGMPGLGYKRDLSEDLVVAPYASLLALSMQPLAVLENIERLERLGVLGRYGLYEALDYTKSRLLSGETFALVQAYMAHHQGMVLVATTNYLLKDVMVERFHADERIKSVELLLQEKIPQNAHLEYPHPEPLVQAASPDRSVNLAPWPVPIHGSIPQAHVLARGKYSVMITSAGGGYSQWEDFALTRWQADTTRDDWGSWVYVQDREDGTLWSATCQPMDGPQESQEAIFSPHQVEFRRWDHELSLHTEITVADGVEIRRVTILNNSTRIRKLKLVSYGEVVLAPRTADLRHPAFNKLFIESEYLAESNALLFRRRLRSADEKGLFLAHALVVEPGINITREYETDRDQFIGRGQTACSPLALQGKDNHLSKTLGSTLDPIFSLSQYVDLLPNTKAQLTFLTIAASTRAETLNLLATYQSRHVISRAFEDARMESQQELLGLGLNSYGVEHIQKLLSALFYPISTLRAPQHIISRNEKGQSGLWAYGISGDYPILLLRLHVPDSALLVEALQAYMYWRNRRIKTNLVILDEQETGYAMGLHHQVMRQLAQRGAEIWLNQRDGIFVLRADQIVSADRGLIETVAGVILDDRTGTLVDHAKRLSKLPTRLPAFTPSLSDSRDVAPTPRLPRPMNLLMDNGLGGFSPDGHEYVMYLKPGQHTPHPWINVIANDQFGFLVSEAGAGCTWAGNSAENRLTPWRNDPVTDMPGEVIYLRDEETGVVWSPTPMPIEGTAPFLIRHGAGYSIFEHQSHGLNHRLRLFAAVDAPVKIAHLRLENLWNRPRRITVTYYAEWVLGASRETTQMHIVPDFDPLHHALLASNRYSAEFGARVAFLAANKKPHGLTADRTEFLGRMGSMRMPAALGRIGLGSKVAPGLDPCAAIQLHIDLAPGEAEEVFFLIGQGVNREDGLSLIRNFQSPSHVEAAWQAVHQHWDDILGAVTVQTPDAGMDILLNRWALYQTLACRIWGRTGFYQSSGAFGFRDQLQDALALLHARPDLTRAQILNAARHQFDAGDVLHWWNPPSGKGVRTRFSDDLLWLPYVTAEYVQVTGDASILQEQIPFLQGTPLGKGEVERYALYESAPESYSLYEHCRRAVAKGSTAGIHGLPLMGSGDWNDGMNRVGIEGQGESIWMGWFLHATLKRFAALSVLMSENPAPYHKQAAALVKAIETYGWDGAWYMRAFYDDGTPLGSKTNHECQIDSIAQSWAVLSNGANPKRAEQAMESVFQILVKQTEQMVLLFTPPFDKTAHDPGYIKGYAPGVRENGGQYTHAATWTVWAFAKLGQGGRAEALFRLLNPIYHADTPTKVTRYKVEPYVVAADVYSVAPHTGTGGWTWYTGSSGWMYRLGIEAILGISRQGDKLMVDPCIPKIWPRFKASYRFGRTRYQISVDNPENINRGVVQVLLDGKIMFNHQIPLVDDGRPHDVHVVMGSAHEVPFIEEPF